MGGTAFAQGQPRLLCQGPVVGGALHTRNPSLGCISSFAHDKTRLKLEKVIEESPKQMGNQQSAG